ncbi:MAG: hypothetical protein RBT69_07495 [Spirochaetia bacterium]|jgi:hypothetical protein|nr:hypothetical protein [Spirochaetia bacterium]
MSEAVNLFRINQNRKLSSIDTELSVWQEIDLIQSFLPEHKTIQENLITRKPSPSMPQTLKNLSIAY